MHENTIEQYLVDQVKAKGGEVRKVKWIGRNGAPDRLVMLPDRTVWVELKAPGEKCRPHQIREHERMCRMGQHVVVVDSHDGVDEVLA
ncbi:VRR-NUC domain-containing protein [Ralstonia syzygii]|uniref:VRR-NUC domain-containing protein n=1 Tax=Ralstonia syzygii TaxID=28097 RepID=UPI0018D193E0|nr:VRR-NUC domain-containing protein [Ralstonia syzygii]